MGAFIYFLLYTAFLTPKLHDTYRPELAQEDRLRLPEPRDQVAGLVELSDGYHKRVRTWLSPCSTRAVSEIA